MKKIGLIAAVAVALLVGGGIGSVMNPAKTVTKTVTVQGPERIVTKEVKVPETPQSCLDDLDRADALEAAINVEQDAITTAMVHATATLRRSYTYEAAWHDYVASVGAATLQMGHVLVEQAKAAEAATFSPGFVKCKR